MSMVLLSLASQIEDLEFKITGDGSYSVNYLTEQLAMIKADINEISTKKKREAKYQTYVERKHFTHNELVKNYSTFIEKRQTLAQEILNCPNIPPNMLKYITKQNDEIIELYKRRIANSEKELNNLETFDGYINNLYGTLVTKQFALQLELEEKLEILEEINSEQFQQLKKHLQIL